MNRLRFASRLTLVLAVGAVVSSCGGGGGGSSSVGTSAGTAEGLFKGTTSNGRAVTGLVLDDGTYYVLYGVSGSSTQIAGVVQGTGTSANGSFTSTDARDFNLEGLGVLPAAVSASFTAKSSLNGTVTYSATSSVTFTSTYAPSYEAVPTLATVAAKYVGQVATSSGVENANVTISADGTISGSGSSGCQVSGSVTPRPKGNVYNVRMTFGGAPCLFANQSLVGIGYFDAAAQRIYAAAPNSGRTDGVLFAGTVVPPPAVTSATIATLKYGQPALVTINGTSLDADLSVTSAGCKNMTRSTTAPNASSATTAYYTCTVSAIGSQSVAITRTSTAAALNTLAYTVPAPQVTMTVSNGGAIAGSMVFTLAPDKAPITVDNFLAYVNSGFFTNTVFHRVVKGFVIQGGGFLANGTQKTPTFPPIALEVGKGLSNTQWTLAMARTSELNSATSQFFINTVDNVSLDTNGGGYAVFGSVTTNTALAAAIENAACSPAGTNCQPTTAIVISAASQTR